MMDAQFKFNRAFKALLAFTFFALGTIALGMIFIQPNFCLDASYNAYVTAVKFIYSHVEKGFNLSILDNGYEFGLIVTWLLSLIIEGFILLYLLLNLFVNANTRWRQGYNKNQSNKNTKVLSRLWQTFVFYLRLMPTLVAVVLTFVPFWLLVNSDYSLQTVYHRETSLIITLLTITATGIVSVLFANYSKTCLAWNHMCSFSICLMIASDLIVFCGGPFGWPIGSAAILAINCFMITCALLIYMLGAYKFLEQRFNKIYSTIKNRAERLLKGFNCAKAQLSFLNAVFFRFLVTSKLATWWIVNTMGPKPLIAIESLNNEAVMLSIILILIMWALSARNLLVLTIYLGHHRTLKGMMLPFEPWLVFQSGLLQYANLAFATYHYYRRKAYRRFHLLNRRLLSNVSRRAVLSPMKFVLTKLSRRFSSTLALFAMILSPTAAMANPEANKTLLNKFSVEDQLISGLLLASPREELFRFSKYLAGTITLGGILHLGHSGLVTYEQSMIHTEVTKSNELLKANQSLILRYPSLIPQFEYCVAKFQQCNTLEAFASQDSKYQVLREARFAESDLRVKIALITSDQHQPNLHVAKSLEQSVAQLETHRTKHMQEQSNALSNWLQKFASK